MKFATEEDIDRPVAEVYAAVTDFAGFERAAVRRGVEIERRGSLDRPQDALSWDARFSFRGSERTMRLSVAEYVPPQNLRLDAVGSGMVGNMDVTLVALDAGKTRLSVAMELKPRSLAARLLVQSLKLARQKLNRKFRQRVAEFARDTESRTVAAD